MISGAARAPHTGPGVVFGFEGQRFIFFYVWVLSVGVWGLGFGVWGLDLWFRIWSLGIEVLGLETQVLRVGHG